MIKIGTRGQEMDLNITYRLMESNAPKNNINCFFNRSILVLREALSSPGAYMASPYDRDKDPCAVEPSDEF